MIVLVFGGLTAVVFVLDARAPLGANVPLLYKALDMPPLNALAGKFVFLAFAAWTIVAAGWLASLRTKNPS